MLTSWSFVSNVNIRYWLIFVVRSWCSDSVFQDTKFLYQVMQKTTATNGCIACFTAIINGFYILKIFNIWSTIVFKCVSFISFDVICWKYKNLSLVKWMIYFAILHTVQALISDSEIFPISTRVTKDTIYDRNTTWSFSMTHCNGFEYRLRWCTVSSHDCVSKSGDRSMCTSVSIPLVSAVFRLVNKHTMSCRAW